MKKLVTLAVFTNDFEVRYNLLKGLLEKAGIEYMVTNENMRSIKPAMYMTPTNVSIEVKVFEEQFPEAIEILNSIV